MAGLVTRTVTLTSQGANGQTITSTYEVLGNDENNLSETIAASSTNVPFLMTFAHAAVQCVDFAATVAMTLKFNSTGSPAPQIVLAAGQQLHWDIVEFASNNTLFPNPFTADITEVFVSSTLAGNLNISVLLNV